MKRSMDAEVKELARSLWAARDELALAAGAYASAPQLDAAQARALALLRRYEVLLGGLAEGERERVEQDLEEPLEGLKDQLTRMCRV